MFLQVSVLHGMGTCMSVRCVWMGECMSGGMHGMGHAWWGSVYGGGCAWCGVCIVGGMCSGWHGCMHGRKCVGRRVDH